MVGAIIAACITATAGCKDAKGPGPTPARTEAAEGEKVIREADAKQPVIVDAGRVVVIKLHEAPSTTRFWELTVPSDGVVKLISDQFVRNPNSKQGPGGTYGDHEFRLRAGKPGKSKVTAKLHHPGEGTVERSTTFTIEVR